MSRSVSSIGIPAITESMSILRRTDGRAFVVVPGRLVLQPGSVWSHDAVLLSAARDSVRYARADTVFTEDTFSFLAGTYSPESRVPAWMKTLNEQERSFAFQMAHTLSPWWGPRGSVAAWLNSFGTFYCLNRPEVEMAMRDTRLLLDRLLALRPVWTSLFFELAAKMGEGGRELFERWIGPSDAAPLLGVLLGSHGDREISLDRFLRGLAQLHEEPTEDFSMCVGFPQYRNMLERAEGTARRLAPQIARLRARLWQQQQ